MALVIKRIYQGLVLLEEIRDPRTYGDPYLASPLCLVGTIALYIFIFKHIGPRIMEKRQPYNVKTAMIIYNIIQILLNAYLTIQCAKAIAQMKNPLCESIDFTNSPLGQQCLHLTRIYTYLKIFDAGDTLFFLLRKSYRQISFLHIYHHCGMMTAMWIGLRYFAGGSALWVTFINSFVHCIMFTYYLLTVLDSSWKQNLIIKRSLTQIQLIQFATFAFIFGRITLFPNCDLPRFITLLFTIQNFFMMFLFGDFYVKAYMQKPKKA